jgi:hypothetical protein
MTGNLATTLESREVEVSLGWTWARVLLNHPQPAVNSQKTPTAQCALWPDRRPFSEFRADRGQSVSNQVVISVLAVTRPEPEKIENFLQPGVSMSALAIYRSLREP